MTRNYIPTLDGEFKFTRLEYARLLGCTANAVRMRMRHGKLADEYILREGKYLFRRPRDFKQLKPVGHKIHDQKMSVSNGFAHDIRIRKKVYNRGNTAKGAGKYTNRAFKIANEVKVLNTIQKKLPKEYTDEINDEVINIARERVVRRKEEALTRALRPAKNYGGLLNQDALKAIEQREQSSLSRVSFTEDKALDAPGLYNSSVRFGSFGQEENQEKEGVEIDTRDFPAGNEEPEFRDKIEESIWRLKNSK